MYRNKRITSLCSALTAMIAVFMMVGTAPIARAAVVPATDLSDHVTRTLSASLKDFTGQDELILDSASGKASFTFDIPAGDYADNLRLKIYAVPQGDIDRNAQIMVRFNNGRAVPIKSRGNRFSAEISLSGNRIRTQNNSVTLTYTGADAHDCAGNDHGKWIVDLSRSFLSANVQSKTAGYQISHLEQRLSHPMTAPKSVAIIAKGQDKTALEALAAQAIGLRVQDIPSFKLRESRADLKVYIGTRAQLGRLIKDPEIAADKRPVIGVQSVSRRPQIIITADTPADVKALVQSFAYAHLPRSRRTRVSLAEMSVQMPFSYETAPAVTGRKSWSDLGGYNFDSGLNPAPATLNFKVHNAQLSTGELRLGVSKSDDIADSSRVSVTLNETALGYANLDKSSKTVAFAFPAGSLLSGTNTLRITPALTAGPDCGVIAGMPPSLLLTGATALNINTPSSANYDLGSFATSGAPFATVAAGLTDVYLTGGEADRAASLQILAKAAQTSGEGWTAARYMASNPGALAAGRNTVVLGPLPVSKQAVLASAPRALKDAMRGRMPANRTTIATGNSNTAFELAARQSTVTTKTYGMGVAAVFAAPDGHSAIGIFSAPRASDFSKLASSLTREPNWSNLSGGVARWNRDDVTLLQTSDTRLIRKMKSSSDASGALIAAIDDFNVAMQGRVSTGWNALMAMAPKTAGPKSMPKTAPETAPKAYAETAPALRVTAPKPRYQRAASAKAAAPMTAGLRGRSGPAVKAQYFQKPENTLTAILDWSRFDSTYFKANVAQKTSALFSKMPDLKGPNMTAPDFEFGKLTSENIKSKWMWILLVGIMAMMLLGLAAPASSNKNIS